MASKKIIPKASNFLVFPIQLKIAIIIHKKIIEGTAITAPTENTSFVFIKLPNKNKYGIIKILNDIKLAIILFFLSTIPRKKYKPCKNNRTYWNK